MLALPTELSRRYEALLLQQGIAGPHRPHYVRWLRYYWDFCHKYAFEPDDRTSLRAFGEKLRAKKQADFQRKQAQHAVALYYTMILPLQENGERPRADAPVQVSKRDPLERAASVVPVVKATPAHPSLGSGSIAQHAKGGKAAMLDQSGHAQTPRRLPPANDREPVGRGASAPASAVQPSSQDFPGDQARLKATGASWVSVYERLDAAVKVRHYSPKTLQAYRHWTRKFQTFTKSKDPSLLAMEDVKGFLSFLAVERKVAASSQNQAFNALLFLFNHALEKEFGKIEGVVRAKRTKYIPVVLSRAEVDRVFHHLGAPYDLVAKLLYGCGLRLFECLKLRVQDLNFELKVLTVHDGKGRKDRTLPLPHALVPALKAQLETVMRIHRDDLAAGYAGTFLPSALSQKYKRAEKELVWQWLFPAKTLTQIPGTREYRRYHLHESHVQAAIKQAVQESQIPKRASAHTFRHSFASHLLQANYDIRTIQELLGHSDVKTTMIYTHTVPSVTLKAAKSPLDF